MLKNSSFLSLKRSRQSVNDQWKWFLVKMNNEIRQNFREKNEKKKSSCLQMMKSCSRRIFISAQICNMTWRCNKAYKKLTFYNICSSSVKCYRKTTKCLKLQQIKTTKDYLNEQVLSWESIMDKWYIKQLVIWSHKKKQRTLHEWWLLCCYFAKYQLFAQVLFIFLR